MRRAQGPVRVRVEQLEERWAPADGDLDLSFGTNGVVTTNFVGRFVGNDLGRDVLIQPDGKIVVVGYSSAGGTNDFALSRYHANGQLDSTFGSGGKVLTDFSGSNDFAFAAAIQADGKIVVVGYSFTSSATGNDFAIARYTSSGQLDTTFGNGGKATVAFFNSGNDQATSVALQGDGKIVVAGFCSGAPGGVDFAAARLQSDGQLDTTFGNGGRAVVSFTNSSTDLANSVAVQSDGKIVLAGSRNLNGNFDFAVARLQTDGALDPSFGNGGKTTAGMTSSSHDDGQALSIQPDGRILVAGFSSGLGTYDFSVMRFTAGGQLDTTFDHDGKVATDFSGGSVDTAFAIAVQADGKIVVAGFSSHQTSPYDIALLRYRADGSLDSTFSGDGKAIVSVVAGNDHALGLALQSDGNIVIAGYAAVPGNSNDFAVVRLVSASNAPPVANAGGPYFVLEGGAVTLDGTGSSDINQPSNTLSYLWDLDGDGIFGETGVNAANGDEIGATPTLSAKSLDGPTSITVWLLVTDAGGLSDTASATVSVLNAPPHADAGEDLLVNEGDEVTLTGSYSDSSALDSHTLRWKIVDQDGNVVIETSGPSVTFTALDNGVYSAHFTVTDDDGASDTDSATVTVQSLPPTAYVAGPDVGVRGQSLHFTFSAKDPGPVDDSALFSYLVDWGDGSSGTSLTGPGSGVVAAHAYDRLGTFTVRAIAVDKDGIPSTTATWKVEIKVAALQPDPLNPGRSMLVVSGSEERDHLIVQGQGKRQTVLVKYNGRLVGQFAPTSRIVVSGGGGNDFLAAIGHIEIPVWLYGGDGNDRLLGGTGPSLLFGESGNDFLHGGSGRSILIGGEGADWLLGGGNDDVLVTEKLEAAEAQLHAALTEWASLRDWRTRVQNLRDSGVLDALTDDHAKDRILGLSHHDWVVHSADRRKGGRHTH